MTQVDKIKNDALLLKERYNTLREAYDFLWQTCYDRTKEVRKKLDNAGHSKAAKELEIVLEVLEKLKL